MKNKIAEVTDSDYEEIANQVKEGYSEGRLDTEDENGKSKKVYWKIETNAWYE